MASRRPHRTEWRITHGKWTKSLGHRGTRVRLFQRTKDGVFYRDIWCADGTYSRKSLGTTDRGEAEQLGRQVLAKLLQGEQEQTERTLTLDLLWERYQRDCLAFLDNTKATQNYTETQVAILIGFFGKDCDVRTLTEQDQEAFTRARLAGGIPYARKGKTKTTDSVRARAVESNLKILHGMLRWATTVRMLHGQRLLDRHPLEGVKRIREQNPRRAMATWERYQATRTAIQTLAAQATDLEVQRRWIRVELVLALVEATGRRVGSVRHLRWEDIDLTRGTIRWRKESDKKRKEWRVPIPQALIDELRQFQRRLCTAGGLIFPSQHNPELPVDRRWLARQLEEAEQTAGLDKLDGALFHAYRRSWATSRKHLPVADVAAAGGWSDVTTLIRVYQQPDEDTLLAVMSEPRKVTERKVQKA
jgi:integrase